MAEGKEMYKSEEEQVRYDIVKTDFNSCPIKYRMPGKYKKHICFPFQCDCDKYGDTKEQLIKKIMTAFKIAIKKNKEGKFIKEKSSNRQVAEIIAEYLGVK